MLTIRSEQMEALKQYMLSRFERKMIAELRRCFPEKSDVMQEGGLKNLIRTGYERAKLYDITSEYDIGRFLRCLVQYGPYFGLSGETRWAEKILSDCSLKGRQKMDKIAAYDVFSR